MKKLLVSAVLMMLFTPTALFGWGQKGHDIIAYIAEQHLSARARRVIGEILDGKSIVYYSSWMDNLQNAPEWQGGYDVTRTWHYANVDEGQTYETMAKEPAGDVLTATDMVVKALKSGTLNDSLRADYLKMLVHMVGDMHCPMHAGRLGDRGGNDHLVRWFGQPTNLHSIWDTKFIESYRKWSYTEWQLQLDRCNRRQIKQIASGVPSEWFAETVEAAAMLYEASEEGSDLSYQYLYDFGWLAERQLLHGGYRLAALLNEIFG